jgi:hypothetical protein
LLLLVADLADSEAAYMSKGGHVGTSLGGMEFSPERKRRDAQKRQRQEKRWASRSGEVKVTKMEPEQPPVSEQEGEKD